MKNPKRISFRMRKLRGTAELLRFRNLIHRQDLPMKYLHMGTCYGFFKDNNLIAGYCLVHAPLDILSVVTQIPKHLRNNLRNEDPFNYVEFTGYFLNTKKYARIAKLHLFINLIFNKAANIVYSYPTEQTKTEEFFRTGNPLRLYCGVPESIYLPINVEIISKWGICKIVLYHLYKSLLRS